MVQAMDRDDLTAPQRQCLRVIEVSGEALLSLFNDLLDLSKIEAGKIELEKGIVDIQALADGARAIFTALGQDKDLNLQLTVAPSASGCWAGDPNRIRQVLHNLISNALKFTDRGSVRVSISHVQGRLILRVQDTGIGIAPAKLAQVFDKFVQADASPTRRFGGAGLGLTISRELARLMGGDVQVESTSSLGSTIVASLPLARLPALKLLEVARQSSPDAQSPLANSRVLVAEDNATNQFVMKTLLGLVGIEPKIVSNGQEALDAWRDGVWDVVLMDIQMPVMDGLTATKQLRAAERREGRPRTPIIAVTANAMAHHKAEYLAAGMDEFVAKPIDLVSLLQTMDDLIGPGKPSQAPEPELNAVTTH